MAPQSSPRRIAAALAALLALAAFGCGKSGIGSIRPLFNERPTIRLTAAPINEADTAFFAYEMHWSAYDADGRIDHYEYAIDPQGGAAPETTWVRTTRTYETIHFRLSPTDTGGVIAGRVGNPHTFVVRAFDNSGEWSAYESRTFFSFTIAPTVRILDPWVGSPSPGNTVFVGPSFRIRWEGADEDGVASQLPTHYKYRLLGPGDPEFSSSEALRDPQAAYRYFVSRGFAGWDSTSGDSAFAVYRGLTVGSAYVFIVVAFDEAGGWTGGWSRWTNMLPFLVAPPAVVAPRLALWSEYFQYAYPTGGYDPFNELSWVKLEVPGERPVTVNWSATPMPGYAIGGYRWRLDGDVTDETPRTDEETDWYHWSRWSPATTHATFGPLGASGSHNLYVEAVDDFGNRSIGTVHMMPVQATRSRELLVVDDTRLELDMNTTPTSGVRRNYTTPWPAAAELDTFLYAAGGVPWRRTAAGRSGVSTPGLLAGYSFDTLGTRQGIEIATLGVPLSLLSQYRQVLWLVDRSASTRIGDPTDPLNAVPTMRWMNTPGRSSTLSAYLASGGRVWLAGGAVAYTSLIAYNAGGTRANDNFYGLGNTVFSNAAGELVEYRLMYDFAKWRSEMVTSVIATSVVRSPRAVGGWTHPGPGFAGTVSAPDYSGLPMQLRRRALALGDSLPPTRPISQTAYYFTSDALASEYLTRPNSILEDADPDPRVTAEISTLDTLYEFRGGALATNVTGERPACMTYYHGMGGPPVVFTGFDLWSWSRVDCAALVDFVLQDVWGMQRRANSKPR